ncbi:MAG: 3-dehydroquinate synthase II, partial [Candidatus Bathyarchaeia archaeon]
MVEFWISIPSGALQEIGAERLKGLIQSADTVLLSDQELETIRRLGAKSIAAPGSGEIRLVDGLSGIQAATGEGASTALRISVKGKDDEDRVMEAAKSGVRYLLVDCPDWKIIPLENLIARLRGSGVKLIASVNGADEAKTAIETLELGVDGVLLNSIDESEVSRTAALIKKAGSRLEIVEAEVVDKKLLSLGARVCIDTCNIMKPGEGLLVGSQSSGLFLVQAEVIPNPHVEPRP